MIVLLIFGISVLHFCSAQEDPLSCVCGYPGKGDCEVSREAGFEVSAQILSLADFRNRQFCYKYKLFGSDCDTAKVKINDNEGMSNNPSLELELVGSDDVSHFPVTTPNFSTNECYEPQYYCIAKADCGLDGVIALIGTSESSITTNLQSSANPRCTDYIQFYGDGEDISDPFCGEDTGPESLPTPEPFDFELHFHSSHCCQACGSSHWMTCITNNQYVIAPRSPSSPAQQNIYDKLFLTVWNKQMLYWVRKTILIPDGFSVKFQYYNIIVASTDTSTSVKRYSGIKKLFVFDEKTSHYYLLWRQSNKIFNSGILYIGHHKAWFVATKQESPIERRTKGEDAFVRRAVEFLKPFYTNDPILIDIFDSPIDYRLREFKPNCTKFNDRIRGTCLARRCPPPEEQRRILNDARFYRRVSNDFLVNTFANLVFDTLTSEKPIGKSYYHRGYYDYLRKYTKYHYPSYGGYPKGPQPDIKPRLNCPVLV